ncbi:T9SS type A sorting domain-containing protein [Cryomorpha ignava]|uniref:T9SS type A sorting domain-containing protein n=1 Tax=Cryomorpha ignava TaxID=101383 RepID=A0A7K3WM37_9FLAO|nr:T9SS type A sorting domain-containing protein [Cryomorpha ignava]NEN22713.1 T9SS type A sorting domain-containing protein [Cryomorpha ignava]
MCDINSEIYNDEFSWTSVEGGFETPSNHNEPRGSMWLVPDGIHWDRVIDGGFDTRYFRPLQRILCESWSASFDIELIDASTWNVGAMGHSIFALTAGTQPPSYFYTDQFQNYLASDQDGIMVQLSGTQNINSFSVTINDDGDLTNSCIIDIPWDHGQAPETYHITLERIGGTNGKLTVRYGTTEESCCFTIPPAVNGLSHLQHANTPTGGYRRNFTGTLTRTCIIDCYQEVGCCGSQEISGPSTVCANPINATYTLDGWPAEAEIEWSVQGSISGLQYLGNSIFIEYATGATQLIITARVTCNCQTFIFTKVVNVFYTESADFSLNVGADLNNYTSISGSPATTNPVWDHIWDIYEAESCAPPSDLSIASGSNALRPTQYDQNFLFNGTDDPVLLTSNCYIVRHILTSPDGVCSSEKRRKLLISKQNNGNGKVTENAIKLFPNPVSKTLNIEINLIGYEGDLVSLVIQDINGRELTNRKILGSSLVQEDISSFSNGTYFLIVTTEEKDVVEQMIFVKE